MIFLIQLCAMLIVALGFRLRYLMGWHLKPSKEYPEILDYNYRSKGTTYARHIGIIHQNGTPFIIRKERWYHRYLKELGLASEVEIGDEDFDKQYYITTDFPDHLEEQLRSAELRQNLAALFKNPVKALYVTPDKIWCSLTEPHMNVRISDLRFYADTLKCISVASQKAHEAEKKKSLRNIAFFAICTHASLLTLATFMGFRFAFDKTVHILDAMHWMMLGFMCALVAALLWLQWLYHHFRKSSWLGWVLADFIVFGLAAFFCVSTLSIRSANIHLPQQPPAMQVQSVLSKVCILNCRQDCGKRCTRRSTYPYRSESLCTAESREKIYQEKLKLDDVCRSDAWFSYVLEIQHWETPSRYSFETFESVFDASRIGKSVTVPIHQGALGLRWIDDDEIRPR